MLPIVAILAGIRLADLGLPNRDAIDLMRIVPNLTCDTPALVFAAFGDESRVNEIVFRGASR